MWPYRGGKFIYWRQTKQNGKLFSPTRIAKKQRKIGKTEINLLLSAHTHFSSAEKPFFPLGMQSHLYRQCGCLAWQQRLLESPFHVITCIFFSPTCLWLTQDAFLPNYRKLAARQAVRKWYLPDSISLKLNKKEFKTVNNSNVDQTQIWHPQLQNRLISKKSQTKKSRQEKPQRKTSDLVCFFPPDDDDDDDRRKAAHFVDTAWAHHFSITSKHNRGKFLF